MKTKYFSIITIIIIALAFVSCEKEIEFKGEMSKPLLVVNGFITPDSVIKVQVSKSRFFLSKAESTFPRVTDAKVSLYINNSLLETIQHTENGMYVSTIKPLPGDVVKIVVEKSGETTVQTQTTVPQKVYIEKIDTLNSKIIYTSGYSDGGIYHTDSSQTATVTNMLMRFSDNINERNFYRISMRIVEHYEDSIAKKSGFLSSDDIVFGTDNTNPLDGGFSYNRYYEFSDDVFNGKNYGLKISLYQSEYRKPDENTKPGYEDTNAPKIPLRVEYFVQLHSISRDYFFYLRSLSKNSDAMPFFTEPVQIHSNVENGIGIFGSYSIHEYKLVYEKKQ